MLKGNYCIIKVNLFFVNMDINTMNTFFKYSNDNRVATQGETLNQITNNLTQSVEIKPDTKVADIEYKKFNATLAKHNPSSKIFNLFGDDNQGQLEEILSEESNPDKQSVQNNNVQYIDNNSLVNKRMQSNTVETKNSIALKNDGVEKQSNVQKLKQNLGRKNKCCGLF